MYFTGQQGVRQGKKENTSLQNPRSKQHIEFASNFDPGDI